jgi:DNA-binding SARP family transcriptional activator/tetratricopeptide (TPR) repeat protein
LTQELLDPVDAELRVQLIDSSVAAELNPAIVRALGLPAEFIERLRRRGIPERVLPGSGERFAYHPLVRQFLAERLQRERPSERRRELHARLAEALDATGDPDAVEHWLAAEEPERAAVAVSTHGQALVAAAPATVRGWIERLPAETLRTPPLRLLDGRLAAGDGHLAEAIAPLREAVDGYAAKGDAGAEWLARLALVETLVIQERFEEAIPLAGGFESSPSPAAPLVAVGAAAALAGACRYAEASELYARAVDHPAAAPVAALVRGQHGFWVDLQCGRLDAALAAVREAVAALERNDPFHHLPYLLGMLAVIEDERAAEPEALVAMSRARDVAERTVLGGYVTDVARRFLAGVHARAGRLAEAEHELTETAGSGFGWYPGDAEITRATIAARRGDSGGTREAARLAIDRGALEPWRSRWRNTALLTPVLVRAEQAAWARELVEDALALRPPLASCARLVALRAWLRHVDGDELGAIADVASAWEEAGDEAVHLLRRERPRLEPLLWTAVERGAVDPDAAVAAVAAAAPGGEAVLAWSEHPLPAARRAAVPAAAVSGHPDAAARIAELERDADAGVGAAARAAREHLLREPPPLVLRVLGGFAVRRGGFAAGDAVWGPRRRAAQRLVRFLLAHRDRRVPEDELFEAFWPKTETTAARRSLQVTASSARSVLDPGGAERSALEVVDRTYRLALSERDVVDADEFERAARTALERDDDRGTAKLEAAAERWAGEPLPEDRYEDWAATWRERLIELYARVLGALADARSRAGDQPGALDASRRQVDLDPLDEEAQRRLIVAYARSGRRGEALRQFLACRRALLDGLGLEPVEETAALQRRILAGEPV